MKKLTTEDFIEKAKLIHGNKYDYSLVDYKGNLNEVVIICSKHGRFEQLPKTHKKGMGCRKCGNEALSKFKRMDKESFSKKASKVHNNRYDYSKVEIGYKTEKVDIVCSEHGKFSQSIEKHLMGRGCRSCASGNRISRKEIIGEFKKIHGDRYGYHLVDYTGDKEDIDILCNLHGVFRQRADHHKRGSNCPKCSKVYRKNTKEFVVEAKMIHGDRYEYSKVFYKNARTKVLITCRVHGSFWQTPNNHLAGLNCSDCGCDLGKGKLKLTQEQFVSRSELFHGVKYDYSLSNYTGQTEKVKIICEEHGLFERIAASHWVGAGCPKCKVDSLSELKLQKYLDDFKIDYIRGDRVLIKPLELDFLISNSNIAIECNGIYWHSELAGKGRKYHLNKTNSCKEKGVNLVHIFEHELVLSGEVVKSRLKNILGLNEHRVFARKCKIKEIDAKLKNNFLEEYHIQKADRANIKLGLFLEDKLVSVMTFCKNRIALGKKDVQGEWELSRFCSIGGFTVIGGASKLLKYFERNFKPKKVTSYADKRWSPEGGVYKKMGFDLIRSSAPNYWYFKKLKVFHRFNFRKSVLKDKLDTFDENITEWENMKNNGWNRFWDCGNFVFEKNYE